MIIGIMGAMPDEVDQLCAKLEQVTKETYAGVEYHQGMLNGRQVVVLRRYGQGKRRFHRAGSNYQVRCRENHLLRHCRQHDQQDRHW